MKLWQIKNGRFLMLKSSFSSSASTREFVIVQNWTDELKRLVPTE